jgi:hypothetical protein
LGCLHHGIKHSGSSRANRVKMTTNQ